TLTLSSASTRSHHCSTAPTKPSSRQFTTWKSSSLAVSRPSGNESITRLLDRHRWTKLSGCARGSKVRTHRGTDCPAAGLLVPCQLLAEHLYAWGTLSWNERIIDAKQAAYRRSHRSRAR